MKVLKLFAIFSILFAINISAATVSGNTYCDVNDNGIQDPDEFCTNEAVWVKLLNISKDKLIAQEPLHPSGEFSFNVNATGDFLLFIDDNGDFKDSTPTPPANTLFANPPSGSIDITITTLDEVSSGHKLGLKPDPVCDCTGGDNNMTIAAITIDGNTSDWVNVITDPDNGSCDSGCQTDYDINKTINGVIQSTGRNLVHFAWTGQNDSNGFVYGYTERVGSSTNTETFLFYKDGDADGLMEAGDIALIAGWQGNTGTVVMEICDYVPADPSGDPMVWQQSDVGTPLLYPEDATVPQEWVGSGDGYTINGGLTNCRTAPGLVGSGSADGRRMEWQVPWQVVEMLPFQPITYHVSTMNSSVNVNNPPGQVDDNLGSCTLQAPVVKLDINKTADNTTPRVGENVTYTITVTNSGDATNSIIANDVLPEGVTYVSYSGTDWTCNSIGQDVNCSYAGVLINGGSTSFDIVASVDNNTSLWGQTLTNSVCTSSDENSTLVCDDENITVYIPNVVLDVNKTVSNATPYVDQSIYYTIAVTNTGIDTANNIVVNDALPSGVAYDFWFDDGNWACTVVGNTLDCSYLSALSGGETTVPLIITVDVNGTVGTDYNNTACAQADENTTVMCDSVIVTPIAQPLLPFLTIEKGVLPEDPLLGETIVYGVIVSNVGLGAATNVVVSESLPGELTYVGSSATYIDTNTTAGTYDDGTGLWSGFNLLSGQSAVLIITATVDGTAPAPDVGDTVLNTACANSDQNATLVCDDAEFTVREPNVQLVIDKSVDNENPRVDESVTYTLVVTNNGTDTANNVIVDDTLPADVTYLSSSPDVFNTSTNTWDVGTLAPGESSELNITVSINTGTEGTNISNLACVDADENTTAVCDDANLTVYTPLVILTIQKVSDQNEPPEDANITYTIIVNNIGDDNATNVTVSDTLPADVTYVSAGGNGWTCIGTNIIDCSYAFDLEPGLPTSFDVNVTVNAGTAGTTLTNTACTQADENTTLVCVDNNITVNDDLDLVVTKDVNNSTPIEGENILYTITVTNNGPITATGVVITENIAELEDKGGLTNIATNPSHGLMLDYETWSIGTLSMGETATLLVTATVAAPGEYINFATLSWVDQTDTGDNNNYAEAAITVACPCENISSDSSPAMNNISAAMMMFMTLMLGLFFVRKEEQLNRNER